MTNFEKEYYFIKRGRSDSLPSPRPFHETEELEYETKPLPPGAPPLAFYNISRQWARRLGHPSLAVPPDVMFEFDNLLVRKPVRDALLGQGVSRIFTHPAQYVHDDKTLHDYWYVGFTGKFACLDWELSEIMGEDNDGDEVDRGASSSPPDVATFRFNTQLMASTPINERLLFVIDGCFSPGVVCHKSLLPLFHGFENCGTRATLVEDY